MPSYSFVQVHVLRTLRYVVSTWLISVGDYLSACIVWTLAYRLKYTLCACSFRKNATYMASDIIRSFTNTFCYFNFLITKAVSIEVHSFSLTISVSYRTCIYTSHAIYHCQLQVLHKISCILAIRDNI